MNVESSLSRQMDKAAQGQSPIIHIVTGVPGSGKSYAAELASGQGIFAEAVTVKGTHNDLMKVMLSTASTPNRMIIVDADTVEDAVSSISYARALGSKRVVVEAVFAPLAVCLKHQKPRNAAAAEKAIEERIASLRMMSTAAVGVDAFRLLCNSWYSGNKEIKTIPPKVVIAEKGNVGHVDRGRVSYIKEEIRREGQHIAQYLEAWKVPQERISQLMDAHVAAATQTGVFLQSILERGKIKSAPVASL